jgi:hypothetical protein
MKEKMLIQTFKPVETCEEHRVNLSQIMIPNLLSSLHMLEHLKPTAATHKHKTIRPPSSAVKKPTISGR